MSAINQKDWVLRYSPPLTPSFSLPTPHYSTDFEKESSAPSSFNKISPVLILVIIILAVIFFVCGILHLLVRYMKKSSPFSPIYDSNRYPDNSGAQSLQRQLQQLFRLHDSGLDQSLIDALPVFYFKDIGGLKEQFDCAVCLSEFSYQDKLRLLPICSHAFHIHCIDTWLLSNSTCPLCRGTLIGSSGLPIGNPPFNFNISNEIPNGFLSNGENNISSDRNLGIIEESGSEAKRVFSVRLGKFRSLNCCESSGVSSICNLDARRCYSMGAFQYVVGDSNLQVTQSSHGSGIGDRCSSSIDVEEKKLSGRTRGDSFSVSKIWLWSKKNRFPSSSNSAHLGIPSCVDVSLPIHNTDHNV